MKKLIVCFLFCLLLIECNARQVRKLPGVTFYPTFRHYSGYLEATKGRHLFYWFFESQSKPLNDPVVLWLNGGPGCSSLLGALTENGPLRLEKNGSITLNPFAWNQKANMLYLESPAGVGFTYRSSQGNISTDDYQTAEDNFLALKSFFKRFSRFSKNDFYLAGESYAGIYIPTLSKLLIEQNFPQNFKAAAIGNGLLDMVLNTESLFRFLQQHGFISEEEWSRLLEQCCSNASGACLLAISKSQTCQQSLIATYKRISNLRLNMYNIYASCEGATSGDVREHFINFRLISESKSQLHEQPPCYDLRYVEKYLNHPSVRFALHIRPESSVWKPCSPKVKSSYKMLYMTMKPYIMSMIESGKKVLIYNGDVDAVCSYIGDGWFTSGLGIKEVKPYTPWYLNGQIGGFKIVYENVTFITVHAAGHMVPADKPEQALYIFDKFLNGDIFQ